MALIYIEQTVQASSYHEYNKIVILIFFISSNNICIFFHRDEFEAIQKYVSIPFDK